MLFNLTQQYAIRRVQVDQDEMKWYTSASGLF
jgi:hypothetical protein